VPGLEGIYHDAYGHRFEIIADPVRRNRFWYELADGSPIEVTVTGRDIEGLGIVAGGEEWHFTGEIVAKNDRGRPMVIEWSNEHVFTRQE
jgi:hypothetical protein